MFDNNVYDEEEDGDAGYYEVTFSVYPLFKYFNSDVNDHFLTTDFTEMYLGLYGFNIEGVEAFIIDSPAEDFSTAPLYRYFNKELHDHFYTTEESEIEDGDYAGYVFEKIEGYIFTEESEGLLPLYRIFNKNLNDHVIT